MPNNLFRWAYALTSGEYEQGRSRLTTVNEDESTTHCCLGVACEIYNKFNPEDRLEVKDEGQTRFYDGEHFYLPEKVRTWLGLESNQGNVGGSTATLAMLNDEGSTATLAMLNDEGASFGSIAVLLKAGLIS